jgi:hypothetical protein
MSPLFLFVYLWLVQPLLTSLLFTFESLSVLTSSCSFCTTSYDIQAVSIFQCIQFLSEIRRKLLDPGLSPFPFFSGDLIG